MLGNGEQFFYAGALPEECAQETLLTQDAFVELLLTAEALRWRTDILLKDFGLTGPLYNVLRILRDQGKEHMTCREVSDCLVNHDSDITRVLDRLEARGLASRERSAQDRRIVYARLTPAGRQLVERIDVPVTALNRQQFAPLTLDRLCLLTQALRDVRTSLPGVENQEK